MRRSALIIGSPGTDLPGVDIDIKNMSNYLQSPIGGSWQKNEIKILRNPSKIEVTSSLGALRLANYSFVFFGGHGHYSVSKRTTEVQLLPGVLLDTADLRVGAEKHTIIVDACRVLHYETLRKATMEARFNESVQFAESNARQIFDKHLSKCPPGLVELYSCSLNETAAEKSSDGGLYTSSLFDSSIDWKNRIRSVGEEVFSIRDAHTAAISQVARLTSSRQNPVATYPRSQPYFPFAVHR